MKMNDQISHVPGICQKMDRTILYIGNYTAWLNVVLLLVILVQVILRYVFGQGLVYLEELEWHIFGVLIMFGYGYCLTENAHIRLNVFHRNFNMKNKEIIELVGHVFLLLPLMMVLFIHGIDFVESSYRVNESSDSPLGLPCRWVIKSAIPGSMIYLALALFSRIFRSIAVLVQKSDRRP